MARRYRRKTFHRRGQNTTLLLVLGTLAIAFLVAIVLVRRNRRQPLVIEKTLRHDTTQIHDTTPEKSTPSELMSSARTSVLRGHRYHSRSEPGTANADENRRRAIEHFRSAQRTLRRLLKIKPSDEGAQELLNEVTGLIQVALKDSSIQLKPDVLGSVKPTLERGANDLKDLNGTVEPETSLAGDSEERPRPVAPHSAREEASASAESESSESEVVVEDAAAILELIESDSKETPEGEVERLAIDDYARKLSAAATKERQVKGLKVKVSLIADAFRYYVADGMAELEKADLQGEELKARQRALARTHMPSQGRSLMFVELAPSNPSEHLFLQRNRRFLELQSDTNIKFKIDGETPKPQYEKWKVYIYEPGKPHKSPSWVLAKIDSLKLTLSFPSSGLDQGDPLTLTVTNLLTQTYSADGHDSVNLSLRQLSCMSTRDILVEPVRLTFHRQSWVLPEPPAGFEALLEAIQNP